MQCIPSLTEQTGLSSAGQLRARNRDAPAMATLTEVFADTVTDASVTGFMCAHLRGISKPVLWVQDRLSLREAGRPYLPGLPVPLQILHVTVSKPADVLWTMEEGLRCAGIDAVLGEIWGDPAVLDFTATKRLALRAEAQNIPTWLIRRAAQANLSAARLRWRVEALPSLPVVGDQRAPGQAQWRAELFRARWQAPGAWVARYDDTGLQLEHPVHADAPALAPTDDIAATGA